MDYDLGFDEKLRETVNKYGIKYDPENPIPQDDQLADNVFAAGLEFYEKVGSYCVDTLRVARFTNREIIEALAEAPSEPVFGKDKDAKRLMARPPKAPNHPGFSLGRQGRQLQMNGCCLPLWKDMAWCPMEILLRHRQSQELTVGPLLQKHL